jgi:hypothetical protein
VVTTDNEEAEIVVGRNVPFIASRATDATNLDNLFQTIERQDVGITLRMTPQITADDFVRLVLFEEVSDIDTLATEVLGGAEALGPTTTVRSTSTVVSARDGQTVVIGGLIADTLRDDERSVPFLSDVPVLGHLFRRDDHHRVKTNLLVFLTPHIITSDVDMAARGRAQRAALPPVMRERPLLHGSSWEAPPNGTRMRAEVTELPAGVAARRLPHAYAERHLVLPLGHTEAGIEVAVPPNADVAALDDLRFLYEAAIVPWKWPRPHCAPPIARAYDGARSMADTMDAIEAADVADLHEALEEPPDLLETGEEAPVIRLVNALLFEAARLGASDVHIEPGSASSSFASASTGSLERALSPSRRFQAAIAARVKIMAGLDIGERRLPQDGRFSVRIGTRVLDVRVSIVPTAFGERVVLRLLDRGTAQRDLAELGFDDAVLAPLGRLLEASHGLVLVTGPTGSGKTTTLYAALARLALEARNVMTIEDPIEYRLANVSQMQVSPASASTSRPDCAPFSARIPT